MVKANSVVLYKNTAAVILGCQPSQKFEIKFRTQNATQTKAAVYSTQSVRQKDFIILSENPCSSLESVLKFQEDNSPKEEDSYKLDSDNSLTAAIRESWELLLSDEESAGQEISFEELVSLFRGELKADESYGMYTALKNTLYFSLQQKSLLDGKIIFIPRSQEEINSLVSKAEEKGKEAEVRKDFINRLKNKKLDLPGDSKFMGDVEALALGKTDRSKTLHEAGFAETPENAHKILLQTGLWDITRNPFPIRWGLSMQSAQEGLASPPEEERLLVEGESYAIDNAYSTDPDDAVMFDGKYLWVHIADPASTVMPDSSIDKTARQRGATLYIPEGAARMLAENCLADYALGLSEMSNALSFRILLDDKAEIQECCVFKTRVKVIRYTYEQADELKESPQLKTLFEIAEKNIAKREKSGSVQIDLPEVHISVDSESKKVSITSDKHYSSQDMVREMMLLAGEGAAKFAFKNNIPFPFVSQEAPDIPKDVPEGLAGEFRIVRCMHRRNVGVTPAMHCGLGLNMYSQVTSPLRRYSDLIAHQQLRAFIDGRTLLDKDTMLMRISEGDAGAMAARKAERKSDMHWTLVYLLQNPDWTGQAVLIDNTGNRGLQFYIPSLDQQFYLNTTKELKLNEEITVKACNIDISEQKVDFVLV